MDFKEKYQLWLNNVKDNHLLAELKEMNGKEIEEAFTKDLSFGTAGLRGVMSAGTNRMNVYTVYKASQGLAQYMLAHGMKKCAITYDSRINSQQFSETAAATLARNGIAVVITKECMPTPFLSFMVRELGCDAGINVTASHNPSEYNGYKVYDNKGCQLLDEAADEVTSYIDKVDMFAQPLPIFSEYTDTLITYSELKLENAYVKAVIDEGVGNISNLSAVYTPLNGAGYRVVPKMLAKCGLTDLHIVAEQSKPDGNFTTCPYPNPEKIEALKLVLDLAAEKKADIVIATDPDCDRIGVAAKDGGTYRRLSGNEVGVLLTDYILNQLAADSKMPDEAVIVKTIVTSTMTDAVAESYGAKTRDVLTGFKYIGDVIAQLEKQGKKRSFVLGFEESCGYLKGSYVRDKDGVVAAMLIAQCASYHKQHGMTLVDRLEQLCEQHGYYHEQTLSYKFAGVDGEELKNKLLSNLRKKPLTTLGNSKVVDTCDFLTQQKYDLPVSNVLRYRSADGSQLIIRPSGTEPLIKCYITVSGDKEGNQAKFDAIKAQTDAMFGNTSEKAKKNAKPRAFNTLNTVTTAMLCAVAVILASTLHAFMEMGLANLFAPMHFPILIVGILCGPIYGLIAGVVTPLISALTNASFTYTRAVPMMVELAMYGLITGLLRNVFLKNPKTNKFYSTIVLVIAMVVGRALHAFVKTLIVSGDQTFFAALWTYFAADFTSTWAGIITQLILIPAILYALLRGGILVKYIPDLPVHKITKK
ncbi:MAG: ECF transporter S component [Clostridiales bacterium]|nr:ECF transporter S component [Clostridiales bacterium]